PNWLFQQIKKSSKRTFAASASSIHENEDGHITPALGSVFAGIGAVVLGIGSANDNGAMAVTGGIVLAIGILAYTLIHHRMIDRGIFQDIDKLNGK
ncbi:MAG: hypothetical protein ABI939_09755, partial [Anaerolineaceae bacterium]